MKTLFERLNISKKLAAVFLSLLLIMGIGGSVGLYNAIQIALVAKQLYTDSFKRAETLMTIENEFLSARQAIFLQTIITEPSSRVYLKGSIEEHKDKVSRRINEYRALGIAEGQGALLKDFADNVSRYWEIHAEVEKLAASGNKDTALSVIRLEGNKAFTDSVNALRKLTDEERYVAYAAYQDSGFFVKVIIAATLAFTLLAFALVIFLWRTMTRALVNPILSIETAARKIGAGDLRVRAEVATHDELGTLADAFNRMAEGLEESYNILEKKVDERTEELRLLAETLSKKKQELELSNMELKEANNMKSQFLANISHELRTPLNSIIGFSELLQEKAFGELNERQALYVGYVHTSGGHLLQLINDILDLSKIEAGRMELMKEDFPVAESLGQILGIVRPMAHKKDISIVDTIAKASPMLNADRAKFKQIMLNLLSNAIKFNVIGGRVNIACSVVEEPRGMSMTRYVVLSVADTGIGIKDADKDKLFVEFKQVDSSITREYEGTGLGLTLTKRLVELHGGIIWFDSVYGQGSTFFVKLPQGTELAHAIDLPDFSRAGELKEGRPARAVILVATESADINHLVEIYLSGTDYIVVSATDGYDLVSKAASVAPLAIVLGTAIPKKDGWQALKDLKSNEKTAGIPVIMLLSAENKGLGTQLGATECLEKPVSREKLLGALERIKTVNRDREP
ncbi:MAG: MCP four helix bundle domain-containing protein [Deltaproteobacteria bacterium]|nr:MCP four helix bundle domain-containing protein [Deltaproteobacteria bacterium]